METNQTESVTQPEVNSVPTENSKANDDFKRDMFRYKNEASELREQLKGIALEKEQKSGNLEGVINSLKDEIKQLKHDNASNKLSYAETSLNGSIKEELLSRGVSGVKLDAFMKLVDDNDKSIVELDDKFNVNRDDIKTLIDKNMERYGDLFKKEVKIVDGAPSNNNDFKPKPVDFKNMTTAQMKEYIINNS